MEMMIWQLMEIRGRALFQFSIGVFVRKASYLEMDDSENEKSECSENRFYKLAFSYKNNLFSCNEITKNFLLNYEYMIGF